MKLLLEYFSYATACLAFLVFLCEYTVFVERREKRGLDFTSVFFLLFVALSLHYFSRR